MSARITVNLEQVQPVFDGQWHRAHLERMPHPGDDITTLCGRVEQAEYGLRSEQTVTRTCWSCDLAYRRQHSMSVPADHPALDNGGRS